MSNIKKAFENGKAFIPFITCGDPDLETTAAVVRAMAKNGADLIELGIPFSDPTAEGPTIQGANIRALKGGVTTDRIFELVKELRKAVVVQVNLEFVHLIEGKYPDILLQIVQRKELAAGINHKTAVRE